MPRTGRGRLQLRFLGPGPRGQVRRDDGVVAEFEGWTELGRAIHDLGALDEPRPDDDSQEHSKEITRDT